jgi:hypothetical protein
VSALRKYQKSRHKGDYPIRVAYKNYAPCEQRRLNRLARRYLQRETEAVVHDMLTNLTEEGAEYIGFNGFNSMAEEFECCESIFWDTEKEIERLSDDEGEW